MRNRGVLAGLAITALLLAGCSGDDDPTSDDRPDVEDELEAPTATVDTAVAPTPTAQDVVIEPPRLTYTVVSGDSLGDIAATFGVPLGAIVDVNGMDNPDVIQVGQEIIIPTQEEVDEWQAAQDAATPDEPAAEDTAEEDTATDG